MNALQGKLRQEAKRLLAEKKVDLFVGYEAAALPLRTCACFAATPEEAERLVWNRACAPNLAAYLPQLFQKPPGVRGSWSPPKVGVVAKGCDSRSIVSLIRAKQVERDKLFVLGVPCEGMIDRHKAARALGSGGISSLAGAKADGDSVRLWGVDAQEKKVGLENVLADACLACTATGGQRSPVLADLMLGDRVSPPRSEANYADVAAFEAKNAQERWEHFAAELSRCIRCYACRQACPNCYCRECFAEETSPRWLGVSTDPADVIFFHLGRLMHQAGRCVDCGACAAACPQGIDLRLFSRKVVKDVEELFGREAPAAGLPPPEADAPEALSAFAMDDDQGFMTEP